MSEAEKSSGSLGSSDMSDGSSLGESSAYFSSGVSDGSSLGDSSAAAGSSGSSGALDSSAYASSGGNVSSGAGNSSLADSQSYFSSVSSSCTCDYELTDLFIDAGIFEASFNLTNNGTCNVTVIGFDGVGFVNVPDLPFTVVPGDTNFFGISDVFDAEAPWRIETLECGFSDYFYWP